MDIRSIFESLFCLVKLLSMAKVRNFDVMLARTLNHSVHNSISLCIVASFKLFNLLLLHLTLLLCNWRDTGISEVHSFIL
jgi:hypothetical protein